MVFSAFFPPIWIPKSQPGYCTFVPKSCCCNPKDCPGLLSAHILAKIMVSSWHFLVPGPGPSKVHDLYLQTPSFTKCSKYPFRYVKVFQVRLYTLKVQNMSPLMVAPQCYLSVISESEPKILSTHTHVCTL